MKPAVFHPKARDAIRRFPEDVRRGFGKLIFDLQKGEKLSMRDSRPMAAVAAGVEELRVKRSVRGVPGFLFGSTLSRIHEKVAEDAVA